MLSAERDACSTLEGLLLLSAPGPCSQSRRGTKTTSDAKISRLRRNPIDDFPMLKVS